MSNIYGPDPDKGGTTVRPGRTTSDHPYDLWFKNCTDPSDTNNTVITADFLNFIIANFRNAVRGLSVPENESDDDLMYKMFQAIQLERKFLPIFPSISNGGLLSINANGAGQIEVLPGQSILHRGMKVFLTSDYSEESRKFTTSSNKTYHLRWSPSSGFSLENLSDSGYNPNALNEDHAGFDTTYDDMLCARITTDSSNNSIIDSLLNVPKLHSLIKTTSNAHGLSTGVTFEDNGQIGSLVNTIKIQRNWSRIGSAALVGVNDFSTHISPNSSSEVHLGVWATNRYQCELWCQGTENEGNGYNIAGKFEA